MLCIHSPETSNIQKSSRAFYGTCITFTPSRSSKVLSETILRWTSATCSLVLFPSPLSVLQREPLLNRGLELEMRVRGTHPALQRSSVSWCVTLDVDPEQRMESWP